MNKEYLPYNLAIELKELGFNEMCHYAWCNLGGWNKYKRIEEPITQVLKTDGNLFGTFFNGKNWNEVMNLNTKSNIQCSAPTFSQAFRWFREKKLSDSYIYRYQDRTDGSINFGYSIIHDYGIEEVRFIKENYTSYEESEISCLMKLIEICQ